VARWSAVSFPGMPVWEGIHERVILVPDELRLDICLIISGMAGMESHLKLEIAWTADLESVKMVAESVSFLEYLIHIFHKYLKYIFKKCF
jgi:hypothetical protein